MSGDADARRDAEAGGATAPMADAAATVPGRLLLVCGPAGVGKSTIGFRVFMKDLNAGLPAAYLDLDQLGFVRPSPPDDPGRHQLKAANLAAVWRNYQAAGARHVVAVGPVGDRATFLSYERALPAATITLCRLHAGGGELTRRVMSRADGGSWPQPGDPLRGQPADYLRRVADQAVADAGALERAGIGIRIDTDGRVPAESADLVAAATGWPGPEPGVR